MQRLVVDCTMYRKSDTLHTQRSASRQVMSGKHVYASAGVPAGGEDCSAFSGVLCMLLTAGLSAAGLSAPAEGLSAAGLLTDSSASAGLKTMFGCSLLGLGGFASPSCLTGSGLSDEGSACFARGLLAAAAALTVFDSLHGNNGARVYTAQHPHMHVQPPNPRQSWQTAMLILCRLT